MLEDWVFCKNHSVFCKNHSVFCKYHSVFCKNHLVFCKYHLPLYLIANSSQSVSRSNENVKANHEVYLEGTSVYKCPAKDLQKGVLLPLPSLCLLLYYSCKRVEDFWNTFKKILTWSICYNSNVGCSDSDLFHSLKAIWLSCVISPLVQSRGSI